jgi:hypothetical protein
MSTSRSRTHYMALSVSVLDLFTWVGSSCKGNVSRSERPARLSSPSATDSISWNMVDRAMGRAGKQEVIRWGVVIAFVVGVVASAVVALV